ncbi:hypothetical protein UR09_01460 [Candidatus Nitromaritima sp. SCGC AAA799-A02]|nr:hypothetical protein UR09_01460 [Candidatus Nitromaritima sp. SCGC AAA799-A02]
MDRLLSDPRQYLQGQTVGLVVNQTSRTGDGHSSVSRFRNLDPFQLTALFAPEHGLYGVDQDMAPVADDADPASGLPVKSLYGSDASSLTPSSDLLDDIDNLIFDIQDVGSRYYTFIYTLANCMQTCAATGTRMIVCDRPNPINGMSVEGNLVEETFRSFVGQYPLPNRHGMTVGELANLFNEGFGIHCDLRVVPMQGWERTMWYDQTGLAWVAPSPNMPALATATVYPGMCLIEGTRLSEGRGTTLPFEQVGAPYIRADTLAVTLNNENLPGVFFRPHYFKPQFQKWSGEVCAGVQLHVTDRDAFKPFLTGVAIVQSVHKLHPRDFAWRTEPYEFVSDRPAIDLLYGNPALREGMESDTLSLPELESSWTEETREFMRQRADYLIY